MSEKKERPKATWGQNQAAYLAALEGKQVTVTFTDGKALRGTLSGVSTFEIFVKQGDLEIMVSKGAIKYLHPTAGNGGQ